MITEERSLTLFNSAKSRSGCFRAQAVISLFSTASKLALRFAFLYSFYSKHYSLWSNSARYRRLNPRCHYQRAQISCQLSCCHWPTLIKGRVARHILVYITKIRSSVRELFHTNGQKNRAILTNALQQCSKTLSNVERFLYERQRDWAVWGQGRGAKKHFCKLLQR
jgi:hypothetical protein